MTADVDGYAPKFCGICDRCRQIQVFPTATARDYWEQNHPHEEDE